MHDDSCMSRAKQGDQRGNEESQFKLSLEIAAVPRSPSKTAKCGKHDALKSTGGCMVAYEHNGTPRTTESHSRDRKPFIFLSSKHSDSCIVHFLTQIGPLPEPSHK